MIGLRVNRRRALTAALTTGVGAFTSLLRGGAVAGARPDEDAVAALPRAAVKPGRARDAFYARVEAARITADRRLDTAPARANGDERRYPNLIAAFGKGLPHSALGEIDRAAFAALVKAVESRRAEDFDAIPVGGVVKLVNPRAAFAYGLEGPDAHALPLAAPPAFDSAALAAEAVELYWQALTRDVPFSDYGADPTIAEACRELSRLEAFTGSRSGGTVTPATLFRGPTPGDLTGPYVSQFLLKEVPYGAIRLVPHVRTATPGLDYLVTWDDWLQVQNGAATGSRHANAYRYIRSGRDLAAYVQLDFSYQPFLTACLVLFGMEGTTDVRRPYKGAPYDAANPYRGTRTQSGFATYGVAHVLDLVARVANVALRHSWYHKWLVHRSLRPEEFGGRLQMHKTGKTAYPIHRDVLTSAAAARVFERHGTWLLPQAYPEGSPLHPSYPSGHATIAGACATVLKAFFDESFPIDEPVVAQADGLSLAPYHGPALTVGGELNKLAWNVGMGRNTAGIHWRSDNVGGLLLGEAIALDTLAEMRACLAEEIGGLSVTRFDGRQISV